MSRAQLFLYSQTRSENAGIFVARSRSCVLAGSRSQSRGAQGGDVSPFATPQSQSSGGGPGGPRGKGQDSLITKTVRIQSNDSTYFLKLTFIFNSSKLVFLRCTSIRSC